MLKLRDDMKRLLLQIFRTIVTIVIMGTMAAMIFSLRSQLAEANAKVQALEKALQAQPAATRQ